MQNATGPIKTQQTLHIKLQSNRIIVSVQIFSTVYWSRVIITKPNQTKLRNPSHLSQRHQVSDPSSSVGPPPPLFHLLTKPTHPRWELNPNWTKPGQNITLTCLLVHRLHPLLHQRLCLLHILLLSCVDLLYRSCGGEGGAIAAAVLHGPYKISAEPKNRTGQQNLAREPALTRGWHSKRHQNEQQCVLKYDLSHP